MEKKQQTTSPSAWASGWPWAPASGGRRRVRRPNPAGSSDVRPGSARLNIDPARPGGW